MHEKIQTENKVNDRTTNVETVGISSTMSSEWQCKICTLMNDVSLTFCEACINPRDANNTYVGIQKLVLSLMNQRASQVTFLTSVNIQLCFVVLIKFIKFYDSWNVIYLQLSVGTSLHLKE